MKKILFSLILITILLIPTVSNAIPNQKTTNGVIVVTWEWVWTGPGPNDGYWNPITIEPWTPWWNWVWY